MLRFALLLCIAASPALAAPAQVPTPQSAIGTAPAPAPAPATAPAPAPAPASAAPAGGNDPDRHSMVDLYETYCLHEFASPATLAAEAPGHGLVPATPAEAEDALHGHDGRAFALTMPDGHFVVAAWSAPSHGCVVVGAGADDAVRHALWNITVNVYAGQAELGRLQQLRPETDARHAMQVLIAHPDSAAAQAFIDLDTPNKDGTRTRRYIRQTASGAFGPHGSRPPAHP